MGYIDGVIEDYHSYDVYKQTFIIYDPSSTLPGGNYENVVSSLDVASTIMNLYDDGSDVVSKYYFLGNDMFEGIDSLPVFQTLQTYYEGSYYDATCIENPENPGYCSFNSEFKAFTSDTPEELLILYSKMFESARFSTTALVVDYFGKA